MEIDPGLLKLIMDGGAVGLAVAILIYEFKQLKARKEEATERAEEERKDKLLLVEVLQENTKSLQCVKSSLSEVSRILYLVLQGRFSGKEVPKDVTDGNSENGKDRIA